MKGPMALLVSRTSATYVCDTAVPIDRNHSEIVKFPPHDMDYERVLYEMSLLREGNHPLQGERDLLKPTQEQETKAMQSLGFPEQHWRRDEIDPGENTCEWLIAEKNFQTWFHNPVNSALRLLWVQGHPGSGKSILMKYALNFLEDRKSNRQIITSFFFHGQGVSLQKTKLGFLRSILGQILVHHPASRRQFALVHLEKSKSF